MGLALPSTTRLAVALSAEELLEFFEELAQRLLVWGSEPVILAFNEWGSSVSNMDEGSPETRFAFEQLLYAIRRDLGSESTRLAQGDLLRVFINDLDDYLRPPGRSLSGTSEAALKGQRGKQASGVGGAGFEPA